MALHDELRQDLTELVQAGARGDPPPAGKVLTLRRRMRDYLAGLAAAMGPEPSPEALERFLGGLALGRELEDLILELARQGRPEYLDLPGAGE